MINLIDNAMKYSPCKKQLGIDLLEGSDKVEIRVRDQGIGIAPEEMERIFGNFYRGSGAAQINPKGVGLGLKIVRHIVEAHRGEILVDSRLSAGSTFRVIIPRSKTS
jgi:two-component system, OmpR family, phosphate regulon sensor histidine kinase PhoR